MDDKQKSLIWNIGLSLLGMVFMGALSINPAYLEQWQAIGFLLLLSLLLCNAVMSLRKLLKTL